MKLSAQDLLETITYLVQKSRNLLVWKLNVTRYLYVCIHYSADPILFGLELCVLYFGFFTVRNWFIKRATDVVQVSKGDFPTFVVQVSKGDFPTFSRKCTPVQQEVSAV